MLGAPPLLAATVAAAAAASGPPNGTGGGAGGSGDGGGGGPGADLAAPGAQLEPGALEDSMRFPLYMRLIGTLACLVIFTIGVTGNLLVPLVVIKTKYLRNSTNLFLINLSVADLLVLIVCMPMMLIELHSRPETWLLGEPMCKLTNYVETLAANGSISTILAISFERYYAICKPLKAGYKCTRLRATIIICVVWLLSSIMSSPIYMMASSTQVEYQDRSLVYNCILETSSYWPKMYVFVSFVGFFCLPLLVLMLVYWLISRRLIRENVAMLDTTTTARNHHNDDRANSAGSPGVSRTHHHQHYHQGRCLNIFNPNKRQHIGEKRNSSPSTSTTTGAMSSLFNSIRHYNYHGQKGRHNAGVHNLNSRGTSGFGGRGVGLAMSEPAGKRISARASDDVTKNDGQRRPLMVGKAMSLDYGANGLMSGGNQRSLTSSRRRHTEEAADQASGRQSCWRGHPVAALNSHANTDSSNADVTTTTTTTASSTTTAELELRTQRCLSSSTPRKASLPGGIFSADLGELVSQLLSMSSRFIGSAGGDRDFNQNKTSQAKDEGQGGGGVSDRRHYAKPGGTGHNRAPANMIMSSAFCDIQSYNEQDRRPGTYTAASSENELDVSDGRLQGEPLMHSCTIDCARTKSTSQGDTGNELGNTDHTEESIEPASVANVAPGSVGERAIGCDMDAGKSPSSSFSSRRRPKRSLESRRDRRYSNHERSRFKWAKGFSVSSSSGSTYTNSTFLTSETGSISPSLQNSSRQRATPSPPRAIVAQSRSSAPAERVVKSPLYRAPSDSGGAQDGCDGSGSGSEGYSEGCSPETRTADHKKKSAHFDEDEIDLALASSRKKVTRALDRPASTNSDSLSADSRGAGNSRTSERSFSQESLSNAPASKVGPWFESQALNGGRLREQKLCPSRASDQHNEHPGRPDARPEIMGGQNEEHDDRNELRRVSSVRLHDGLMDEESAPKQKSTQDHIEPADSRAHCDIVTNLARPKIVRSFTEDQGAARADCADGIQRVRLFPIDAALTPLQRQYESSQPSNHHFFARHSIVNAHKHISKVNLIAMAQNLSDNLHFRRHNGRSGSHPVVSHHTQVANELGAGAHTEFLAVRDISKRQQMDSRRQVVAMLAFVVACFFLLFLPYRVLTIWLIFSTEAQVQSLGMDTYYSIVYFARILIYLHSAINPIAYNLISTKFRRAFMSILLCRGSATRRNFTADPQRFLPHDCKGQLNANNNQNRSTGTVNETGGSRGPRSPRGQTIVTK